MYTGHACQDEGDVFGSTQIVDINGETIAFEAAIKPLLSLPNLFQAYHIEACR